MNKEQEIKLIENQKNNLEKLLDKSNEHLDNVISQKMSSELNTKVENK